MISIFEGVKNIVGKGENAANHPFLLFPQCFKGLLFHCYKNQGLFGKGFGKELKGPELYFMTLSLTLSQTSPGF